MPLLESACRCGILAVDKGKLWNLLLREGKSAIQKENWADRIAFALYTLKNYEGKQVLAQVLAKEAKGFLQNRFTQTEVRRLYQSAWAKYRDRGWFRGLLESFVEREETENIRLIQEQVWNLADSIVDPGSEVRCALGKSYDSFLKRLTEDKNCRRKSIHGCPLILQVFWKTGKTSLKTFGTAIRKMRKNFWQEKYWTL